ncbi:MAG: class I SAM-dependent methyltransferase [Acidobacteriia bacterium]|jgi:SAM-dependent methyltransferase|nr:class I SAM-dependent methyltransferase [Terriglobia bacterium]
MVGEHYSLEELQKLAQDRLRPSITNPNYLVLRRRAQLISNWIGQVPGKDLRVLDIGGRYQPYRPLLQERLGQYIAIDVLATRLVNVVGKGELLPFRANTFDLVIATGVFEYFPRPHLAADQVHEVLKPGGVLLMSVGAVSPRFVDDEHWRYMRSGLRSILSPFSQVEIVPEVSSLGGFCRLINAGLNIFAKYELVRGLFQVTVFPLVNLAGLGLEKLSLSTNDQMAGNYCALARK